MLLHASTPDNYSWSADWEAVIDCKNVAVVDLRYLGLVKIFVFQFKHEFLYLSEMA